LLIKDSLNSPSGTFSWLILANVQPDNTYKIRITSVMDSNISTISLNNFAIDNITFLNEIISDNKDLWITNYPNPFSYSTTFDFNIEEAAKTTITIFSLEGKELELIFNKFLETGNYKFNWDSDGIETGVYFYKITSGNKIKFEKIIILK
ncbi:MAG: T9SS type A sorting domain-containing protein, partial [FCB group bacterium]